MMMPPPPAPAGVCWANGHLLCVGGVEQADHRLADESPVFVRQHQLGDRPEAGACAFGGQGFGVEGEGEPAGREPEKEGQEPACLTNAGGE